MSDRIRLKVGKGEALDEAELALLRRRARDCPTDAGVHLALGRALVELARLAQAEAPLQRALQLQPGDPEPMKALAALALRQAEWRRARGLVEQVLAVEPLDLEARRLLAELDARQPLPSRGAPTLPEFSRVLSDRLKLQSTPHVLQGPQLLLRLGRGGVARVDLPPLLDEARQLGRPPVEVAALVARELALGSLGLGAGPAALLARVLPVLRDPAFVERGVGLVRREGPGGLWLFYVVEDPEVALYVPEGALGAAGLTLEALDEAAWRNLAARPAEPRALDLEDGTLRVAAAPTGLWALARGDGHDAARLLTPRHQAALAGQVGAGPLRVYLGLRELVLACLEADSGAVGLLEGLEAAREGIGGGWRLADGRLTPLPDWQV
jgi:tetratricopeptide (TPR) repeat protein